MVLHESGEDYLEAILVLRQQKGHVRSIDVAQHLGFSKPSVSRAVSILKTNGYLTMEKDGRLELTPEGEANAQRVYERHRFLSEWLMKLGVTPEVAAADACRIEHDISAETFECLKDMSVNMVRKIPADPFLGARKQHDSRAFALIALSPAEHVIQRSIPDDIR